MNKEVSKKVVKILIFVLLESGLTIGSNPTNKEKAPTFNPAFDLKFSTSYQSNENLDFYEFIGGINSIYVITPEEIQKKFGDKKFNSKYRAVIKEYLSRIGFENTAISSDEHALLDQTVSLRQAAIFQIGIDCTDNFISNVSFSFYSCNKDEFRFSKDVNYYIDERWDAFLFSAFKTMFWHSVQFNPLNSIELVSARTNWNTNKISEYLRNTSNDKLEGIYEKFGAGEQFKIGLIKKDDNYEIIYLSGAKNKFDWQEGDSKGIVRKTSINNFYKVEWVLSDKSTNKEVYLSTSEENFLDFEFMDPQISSRSRYIKMLPVFSTSQPPQHSTFSSSGTGFVLSEDGLIVTNYHVVEKGKSIAVQFNEGNSTVTYKAEILSEDRKNDLAILSVKDDNFKSFTNIPYKILDTERDIGVNVFTLGFPLIQTMGNSIKLANGVISAQTGFMDNKLFYQVTIPINPGNSGGPLFDDNGNIIGVINAKHSSAENVAYALKSSGLKDVISKINKSNLEKVEQSYQKKSLPEIVKSVRGYICLITVD